MKSEEIYDTVEKIEQIFFEIQFCILKLYDVTKCLWSSSVK